MTDAMSNAIAGDRKCGGHFTEWPDAHVERCKVHFEDKHSHSKIADLLNAEFGTLYTRNAAIGKCNRMGWKRIEKPRIKAAPRLYNDGKHFQRVRIVRMNGSSTQQKLIITTEAVPKEVRCVEIVPRNLTLADLGPNDCRYPYPEGVNRACEPITFCGLGPLYVATLADKLTGDAITKTSKYCEGHHFLCVGPGTGSERAATRGVAA